MFLMLKRQISKILMCLRVIIVARKADKVHKKNKIPYNGLGHPYKIVLFLVMILILTFIMLY